MTSRLVENNYNNCEEIIKIKSLLMISSSIFYKYLTDIFKSIMENNEDKIYKEKFKHINIVLNEEQNQKRYDIIMVIKKFIIQNKINSNIFYNIIHLFDLLIIKNNKHKIFSSLEKLGLGALYICVKFFHENNSSSSISNKKYKSLYNNRYYSMQEIAKIEMLCLKLINYNLIKPSPIYFIEVLIMNEILHNSDLNNKNNNNFHDSFNHLCCLIFKNLDTIIINSNEYIKYNPFYLSCFIIGYSNNILNMEKFPKYLTTFCGLTNINFNEVYNELWSNYKNILNNNKNNGIIRDNLYLTNDSKQSELKNNLNRVDKGDILNIENNKIPSFRKFHSKLYINPFLDSKISLKNSKAKKNQSNDINIKKNTKYKIYSTHATKKNIPKNIHKKINNIYKFNPCIFTFNLNSTSNIGENNLLTKFKTSKCFKKSNDKITINKGTFFKNIKKYEPKNIDNLEEKNNEENKTSIVNSNNQNLKNNNSIQYIFQNKASNLFNNKKLNIEL